MIVFMILLKVNEFVGNDAMIPKTEKKRRKKKTRGRFRTQEKMSSTWGQRVQFYPLSVEACCGLEIREISSYCFSLLFSAHVET